MKKLKKIAAVLASSVLLTSTMAFGMAASYPQPFVNNGAADVALVWGGSDTAATTDLAAVTDISTSLSGELTTQSTGPATVTGGDFVKLERGKDVFNLGESVTDFYTTLDEGELSTILTQGIYKDDNNNEYDFDQSIQLGSALTLTHFSDTEYNDEEPTVGFDIGDETFIMNYTLNFEDVVPDTDWAGTLENTDLVLLGKTYYVSDATNTSTGKPKLTLLDSANSAVLNEGETETIIVGDESYDVSINFINTANVKLDIDGETTDSLSVGSTYKLENDVYVGIQEINVQDYAGGQKQVVMSIGIGKLVLEDGQEVEMNGDPISDLVNNDHKVKAYFELDSSADLDKIIIEWKSDDDDVFITPEVEQTLPGFESVKISMNGLVTGDGEETVLDTYSDSAVRVSTTVEEGDLTLELLYSNTTEMVGIGQKSTRLLKTQSNSATSGSPISIVLDESTNDQFVATWISGDEAETYVFELTKAEITSGKNVTVLESKVSGGADITLTDIGEEEEIGNVMKVTSITAASGVANITLEPLSAGTAYTDRVVTEEGLQFRLPVQTSTNVASSSDGEIFFANASLAGDSTWDMNFTEEDSDNNIGVGGSFTVTFGIDTTNGPEPTTIGGITTYETESSSKVYVGHKASALGTKVLHDKPTSGLNDVTITYFGEEVSAEVFVTESGASVITDGEVSVMTVTDSEASTVSSKNLIVVGGSCVNSVAADLLGVSAGTCGDAWEAATGVGSGSFLIETFSRSGGKVATLVAGYNAGDTTNAAQYLTTQDVDTGVGMKYTGTTATEATLVTS
jgi:hypothetical protein